MIYVVYDGLDVIKSFWFLVFTYRQLMELVLKYNNRYRPVLSLPFQLGLLQGAIMERLPVNLFTVTRDQVRSL